MVYYCFVAAPVVFPMETRYRPILEVIIMIQHEKLKWSLIAKQSKVSLIFFFRKRDISRATGACVVQLCPTNSTWFYNNNQNRRRFTVLKSWGHYSDWSFTCLFYDNSLCVQSLVPPDPMSQFHLKRGSPDEEFPDLCRNSTWMGRILTPAMYRRQFHRCTHSGVIFDDVIRPGLEEPGDVSTRSWFGWLSDKYSMIKIRKNLTFKEHSALSLTSEITYWFKYVENS